MGTRVGVGDGTKDGVSVILLGDDEGFSDANMVGRALG